MIFSIFAPVGVKSLKEHKCEGRRVEKMGQYGNQSTQLHLMIIMIMMIMIMLMVMIMMMDMMIMIVTIFHKIMIISRIGNGEYSHRL